MNKKTKRDYFNELLAITDVALNAELVSFINHELELLEKKNKSKSGEMTETQKENAEKANEILAYMAMKDCEYTIKMIREHFGLTAQKVTPIMATLAENGKVTKRVDKRVTYYSLV